MTTPANEEADPALGLFLDLLGADIESHPERLQALDASWFDRVAQLVGDVDVDPDAPLLPEEE